MDDSLRAKNMAKELRQIYCDTKTLDAFTVTARGQFYINKFTTELAWHLITAVADLGVE